jgi:hypothetical protein
LLISLTGPTLQRKSPRFSPGLSWGKTPSKVNVSISSNSVVVARPPPRPRLVRCCLGKSPLFKEDLPFQNFLFQNSRLGWGFVCHGDTYSPPHTGKNPSCPSRGKISPYIFFVNFLCILGEFYVNNCEKFLSVLPSQISVPLR